MKTGTRAGAVAQGWGKGVVDYERRERIMREQRATLAAYALDMDQWSALQEEYHDPLTRAYLEKNK